ncbi:hypothetical protein MPSYJ_00070 [Mycolicibacterium psychrotolerans]|uniref:Uncharacterized protein n=1 Tax=Mycolicibacterium psychrotolerans TaxID=216929 RepID=A0A7I7M3Q9_9MYCO|nr:hypothetical protein MPSYJ_00070 [Mycolicibacterium psychrotolerans]
MLSPYDSFIGYSCLAAGADQLFATEVLAAGGKLHVVLPSAGYATTFHGPDATRYRQLLSAASDRTELTFPAPSAPAYHAAGRLIADLSDVLVAVWDGRAARGEGGTADIVEHARSLSRDVRIIWPAGVTRE